MNTLDNILNEIKNNNELQFLTIYFHPNLKKPFYNYHNEYVKLYYGSNITLNNIISKLKNKNLFKKNISYLEYVMILLNN